MQTMTILILLIWMWARQEEKESLTTDDVFSEVCWLLYTSMQLQSVCGWGVLVRLQPSFRVLAAALLGGDSAALFLLFISSGKDSERCNIVIPAVKPHRHAYPHPPTHTHTHTPDALLSSSSSSSDVMSSTSEQRNTCIHVSTAHVLMHESYWWQVISRIFMSHRRTT